MKYAFSTPSIPGRHRIPRDRATAASPTHTAAFAVPGEGTGVAAKIGKLRFLFSLPEPVRNHYILFFGSTVERSILDRASVESCLSLRFRFFFVVVLACTIIVHTWWDRGLLGRLFCCVLLCCCTMVHASWVIGWYLLFYCCCYIRNTSHRTWYDIVPHVRIYMPHSSAVVVLTRV